MAAPAWELADIFRLHGEAYRQRHRLSPPQRRVMRAIENCRTYSDSRQQRPIRWVNFPLAV